MRLQHGSSAMGQSVGRVSMESKLRLEHSRAEDELSSLSVIRADGPRELKRVLILTIALRWLIGEYAALKGADMALFDSSSRRKLNDLSMKHGAPSPPKRMMLPRRTL